MRLPSEFRRALVEHKHVGGSVGGPGECSSQCACGTTLDGFDTVGEADGLLEQHIASENGRPVASSVTQPGPFRRALLKTIAGYRAPTPRGVWFAPQPDGAQMALELETIADLRAWLEVLGSPAEEVLIEHVDGVVRATSWALWMGVEVRLAAEDPEGPHGGQGEADGEDDAGADDLADVALLGLGEDYHSDTAERIAAVQEAAPLFVRPVPVPAVAVASAPVRVDQDQTVRRADRWAAVTAALAAGCPSPAHVDVSADGWSLRVEVADEAAVVVWADQLDLTDSVASRVCRQRGAVKRITLAGREHPWSVQVVCTVDVALPPAPLADDIVSLAWPEREARTLAVAA